MIERAPVLTLKSFIGGPDSDFDADVELSVEKAPESTTPREADAVVVMRKNASVRSVPVRLFDEKYVAALYTDVFSSAKRNIR